MAYYLHSVRKTPSGHLLHQNPTNCLPNRPYHCGAALSGVIGSGSTRRGGIGVSELRSGLAVRKVSLSTVWESLSIHTYPRALRRVGAGF